jgi:hypothetical protein
MRWRWEHYVPQKAEQRLKLENLLDSQFDKLAARLQIIQEARLRREALSLRNDQAAVVNELLVKSDDRPAAEKH